MWNCCRYYICVLVAPLAGSVDRNFWKVKIDLAQEVAPLAGSVDRNVDEVDDAKEDAGRSPRGERG